MTIQWKPADAVRNQLQQTPAGMAVWKTVTKAVESAIRGGEYLETEIVAAAIQGMRSNGVDGWEISVFCPSEHDYNIGRQMKIDVLSSGGLMNDPAMTIIDAPNPLV